MHSYRCFKNGNNHLKIHKYNLYLYQLIDKDFLKHTDLKKGFMFIIEAILSDNDLWRILVTHGVNI